MHTVNDTVCVCVCACVRACDLVEADNIERPYWIRKSAIILVVINS